MTLFSQRPSAAIKNPVPTRNPVPIRNQIATAVAEARAAGKVAKADAVVIVSALMNRLHCLPGAINMGSKSVVGRNSAITIATVTTIFSIRMKIT